MFLSILATTTTTTTTTTQNPNSSFDWTHLANVLTGLIFHDFILIFVIILVLVIVRYVFNYEFSPRKSLNAPFSEA